MRRWTLAAVAWIGAWSLACATGGSDKEGGLFAVDADGDGFAEDVDCDDDDAGVNPDEDELCDPDDVDEDCNGLADSEDADANGAVDAWRDVDLDGYGDPNAPRSVCELTDGLVIDDTDCDDSTADISPVGIEVCDPGGVDEDCDGLVNDDDPDTDAASAVTYYQDADGDGFGNPAVALSSCALPAGYVDDASDCDDTDALAYPNAYETWYDGVDSDCAGGSDYDQDGDGHDADAYRGDDCDDLSYAAYDGAPETWYDGVDADCSGGSDYDRDGDGHDSDDYGGDDCDDLEADTYAGAPESGTNGDTNCDGRTASTPRAVADYDNVSTLDMCNTIFLDGTGSSDPGGDALTYAWELVTSPSGAPETTDDIVEPDDAAPTFIPTMSGDYVFGLVVANEGGVESPQDLLTLTISERADNVNPVANAGVDQTDEQTAECTTVSYTTATCDACGDSTFTLDASGSTDADGDGLTYTWAVTSGSATLSATSGEIVTVTVLGGAATYGSTTTTSVVVTLTATDCYGGLDTDTITLNAECTGA